MVSSSFSGLNLKANAKRGRRKQAATSLIPRHSTGPVNPLMTTQENIDITDWTIKNQTNQNIPISATQTESSKVPSVISSI